MGFPSDMLDTHAAVKELAKTGLSEAQAEAIVQVQLRTLHQGLVTKEDLFEFRAAVEKRFGSLESAIAGLEAATKKRFSTLESAIAGLDVATEKRFSTLESAIAGLEAATEKRFSTLESGIAGLDVATEKRFSETERRFSSLEGRMSRLTFLVWIILAIVALTNPIAARLIERILGMPL